MRNGIEYIDIAGGDERVVAARLVGRVTPAGMARFVMRVETLRASGVGVRLFVDATGYEGSELGVWLGAVMDKPGHLGTLWSRFERIAFVADKEWVAKSIGLVDAVTPMYVRTFEPEQAAEARVWLLARD